MLPGGVSATGQLMISWNKKAAQHTFGNIEQKSVFLRDQRLRDWIGFANPGRTKLRSFWGVLDWLVPPITTKRQESPYSTLRC